MPTDKKLLFHSMASLCARAITGFEIRYKDEHLTQRVLGFVLRWIIPFNRRYMTNYTSTFYPRVYFPNRTWVKDNPMRAFKILAHEYVHLWDEKKRGALRYKGAYIMPQVLALLSLLALGAFYWKPALFALGFLLFALPWPSPGRRDIERRGYKMSMAVNYWRYGTIRETQIEWILTKFTRSYYYWMYPFSSKVRAFLRKDAESIKDGSVFLGADSSPFIAVNEVMKSAGAIPQ